MLNLNQRQFAKKVGIRQSELSRIESDKVKGTPEALLRKIAEALGENVSYLFEEEKRILSSITHFQNLPLISISFQIEPKHIKMVEKVVRRLIKEFRKQKPKNGKEVRVTKKTLKGGRHVKKNFSRSTDFNAST